MKKTASKVLAFLLAALLIIGAVPMAFAADDEPCEVINAASSANGFLEAAGEHFRITTAYSDEDGAVILPALTVEALNGEIITRVELTLRFREHVSTTADSGTVSFSGDILTVDGVNATSLSIEGESAIPQYNPIKIYYEKPDICEITRGTTTVKYKSVADAVAAAEADDTITMIANAKEYGIVINKALTLDLNGFVIDGSGLGIVITVGTEGKLTLNDTAAERTHAGAYASLPAGGVITGGYTPTTEDNSLVNSGGGIQNTGEFIMNGGTVTGNTAQYGGGVSSVGGTLTFNGGAVTRNTATYNGGGISLENSTLTIEGGIITGNFADIGGGISAANGSSVTLKDGKITSNSAGVSGGGVIFNSKSTECTLTVSGTSVITDNTVNGKKNNVSLPENKVITVGAAGLTEGAEIGVTTENLPAYGNDRVFTKDSSQTDIASYFSSDDERLNLTKTADNQAALTLPDSVKNVCAKIDAIGTVTLDSTEAIDEAKNAYLALESNMRNLVSNSSVLLSDVGILQNLRAAQTAINKIDAIGTVTFDSREAIIEARTAYNALTNEQRTYVTNLAALEAAEETYAQMVEDKAVADLVAQKIDAIGAVTLDSGEAITEARAAYDALTDAGKAYVANAAVLEEAETAYAKAAADKAAADGVSAKIDAIGTVTLDSEEAIAEARAAYEALSAERKALVTNTAVLEAAETAYARAVADKAAADAVSAKINAIGTVTLDSEEAIAEARTAYDALTDAQKALVANTAALEEAEMIYARAAADKAAADTVIAKIDAIGSVTLDSEEAIAEAKNAYDALTDAQKAFVTNLDKLEAAEEVFAKLSADNELTAVSGSAGTAAMIIALIITFITVLFVFLKAAGVLTV